MVIAMLQAKHLLTYLDPRGKRSDSSFPTLKKEKDIVS